MCTGERQRLLSVGVRLLQTTSEHLCLPQGETTARLKACHLRCSRLFQRLREQRHGVGDAPTQGVRRPQGRSYSMEIERKVRILTEAHGTFEQGECPGQV